MQEFSKYLKKRRKELGMSMGELARIMEVKTPNFSLYENGKRWPDKDTMVAKFSNALQVDELYLRDLIAIDKGQFPSYIISSRERMEEMYNELERHYHH